METETFQAVLAAVRTLVREEVVPAGDVIERTGENPEAIREQPLKAAGR
ncbi:hypothetical protein [Nonomuraea sp. NPDC005501]